MSSRVDPRRALVVGVAVAVLAAGCAARAPAVSLREGPRRYTARDYDRIFERWTRAGGVLTVPALEDRLRVDATFFSWDFRWAYAARYAEDARLSEAARSRYLEESLATARREHVFFVALVTERTRWGELNRPSSAFRVGLVDDKGREVSPLRIERFRRASAEDETYFPYVSPWRQLFRVHFPRHAVGTDGQEYEVLGPGTRYFLLRLGGALGTADLRWDVESPAGAGGPRSSGGGSNAEPAR